MQGYEAAVSLLPLKLRNPLLAVDASIVSRVQEIRLREGQAVSLGIGGKEWFVTERGEIMKECACGIICTQALLQQTVDRILEYSVYAHQEELRRGFVTAGGCRIGVAGTAVTECGCLVGYRALSALCIRVARAHDGCAEALMPFLYEDGVHGALICSEPGGGKTSILRDLALQFSRRRIPVTVIDERGELSGVAPLKGCDVLRYAPKAVGLEQAVRCLAPRVVLLDELGDADELSAIFDGFLRGVPTIATVHAHAVEDLYKRRGLREVLKSGAFEYIVTLHGRHAPGRIARVLRTEEWLRERDRSTDVVADRVGVGYDGTVHIGEANTLSITV